MSRLEFRTRVDAPRPASAWAMATVASATLWITQQLAPWAIALQTLALLFSLHRRLDPHPWQRSPIALNLGMLGIVAGTIAVALGGGPSTIALAHFAAPALGLQLIDARPRRTEFLLVALALFQVVLAANLTDSVFFTPLLVAFLFTTVWTLIVHTLRSEALEAGVPAEVARVLSPGLLRTTALASILSLAIAALLFVTLPRLRSSVLTGAGRAATAATAGFSDSVAFGDLGRIRQDARVVLRVETLEGEPPGPEDAYWRGLAFDRFDGTRWRITPTEHRRVAGSAEGGVSFGDDTGDDLVQRIVREPVASGVLFAVGDPHRLQGTVRRLERDASGGLYANGQDDERVRYTVHSQRRHWGDAALRRDHATAPTVRGSRDPQRDGARYLQLPALGPAFERLAAEVVQGATRDADRARAIERHLLTHGRYTDTPPSLPEGDARTPVEVFLEGGMAGHCEYFASAMVLLARRNGLPARLVNGFAGGHENPIGGFVELARSDAHAWVEIHYEKAGWVRYDPTPPDLRARSRPQLTLGTRLRDLGSALELWWFQRVVGFDRADQIGALREAWLAWKGRDDDVRARDPARPPRLRARLEGPWQEAVMLLCCGLAAGALGRAAWRRRRRRDALPPAYAQALRLLARHGHARRAAQPARDFARQVRASVPAPAADLFDALTERYLAARFGGAAFEVDPTALRHLRRALRAGRTAARAAIPRAGRTLPGG